MFFLRLLFTMNLFCQLYGQELLLHNAARSRSPFISLELLLQQPNSNMINQVNQQDSRGNTPLTLITMGFLNQKIYYSAYNTFSRPYVEELIASTRLLLLHGADPTIATSTGFAPINSLIRSLCFFHTSSSLNENTLTETIEHLITFPKLNGKVVIDR